MPRKYFRICTIVNDWAHYDQMKRSFLDAGFDEGRCEYTVYDNSAGNTFEPYSVINRVVRDNRTEYVILCHQDVRADRGDGLDRLCAVLRQLDETRPDWAVAGNAGCTDDFDFVLRVVDPNGLDESSGPYPVSVHSLDENFLVMRGGDDVRCSEELSGFHLYGTDLCLNARLRGRSCHVIDFKLTHLSAGVFAEEFFEARRRFIRRWNPEFNFLYVIREAEIFLSKWKIFHRVFPRTRPRRMLRRYAALRRLMTLELDTRRRPARAWRNQSGTR